MKTSIRPLLLAAAFGVLLTAGRSGGQPPAGGKKEEGKGAFHLTPPLTLKDEGPVRSVAFSPDARWIASSTIHGTIRLWDASSGKPLWRYAFEHDNSAFEVTFSPDGRILACGDADSEVRLLDVATGKDLAVLRHAERGVVSSVAFSPDGRWLASGGLGLVVWDLRTQKRHLEVLETEEVAKVVFSPDGKTIAAASSERPDPHFDSTVRLWDSGTGKQLKRFQDRGDGEITALTFSPSGKLLACGSRSLVETADGFRSVRVTRIRDVASGRTTVKLDEPGHYGLAFSPDGHLLFVSGGGFSPNRLWEAVAGKEVLTVSPRLNGVQCVAFSPDGRAVALGTTDKTVLIHTLAPAFPGEGSAALGADVLERLWGDLGAEDPGKRYQAIWPLVAKPAEAVPFLKGRIERGLPDLDQAVGEGAVRVLELIDAPEARQLLEKLADAASTKAVKQEASAALGRLKAREQIKPLTITPEKPDGEKP